MTDATTPDTKAVADAAKPIIELVETISWQYVAAALVVGALIGMGILMALDDMARRRGIAEEVEKAQEQLNND